MITRTPLNTCFLEAAELIRAGHCSWSSGLSITLILPIKFTSSCYNDPKCFHALQSPSLITTIFLDESRLLYSSLQVPFIVLWLLIRFILTCDWLKPVSPTIPLSFAINLLSPFLSVSTPNPLSSFSPAVFAKKIIFQHNRYALSMFPLKIILKLLLVLAAIQCLVWYCSAFIPPFHFLSATLHA